jgi:hypothetical protein
VAWTDRNENVNHKKTMRKESDEKRTSQDEDWEQMVEE